MTKIAICAPASPITREAAEATRALVAAEFPMHTVHFHEQCFARSGHFAGDDLMRLTAFLECANDPGYDAVWFARGGYGSNRIAEATIPRLNEAARAKTYVGFSDCGYIMGALYKAGIGQCAHGSMPINAASQGGREAVRRVLRWFAGDNSGLEPSLDGTRPAAAFNLITLAMMAPTPLMPDLTDHVVMLEEVSEHLYSVDRIFFSLYGSLPRLAGLRLGEVTEVPENDHPFGRSVEDIVQFWCARAGIPYLGRAEIGHTDANKVVPFGLASPFRGA
ncbi:MAG: LD-carboxypeptidase [Erythrobacter sp.]|uniref:LD-carboxypeptidase n=1 Tax=Erythrobacter sp. TaxID=1042 RepID=UPI00261E655F|nr:LD-carboxypeptidase [Erythrobacter sp.]MDJ0977946.1 LD-carboxypeptidase [Erythrobacter sp.]